MEAFTVPIWFFAGFLVGIFAGIKIKEYRNRKHYSANAKLIVKEMNDIWDLLKEKTLVDDYNRATDIADKLRKENGTESITRTE